MIVEGIAVSAHVATQSSPGWLSFIAPGRAMLQLSVVHVIPGRQCVRCGTPDESETEDFGRRIIRFTALGPGRVEWDGPVGREPSSGTAPPRHHAGFYTCARCVEGGLVAELEAAGFTVPTVFIL